MRGRCQILFAAVVAASAAFAQDQNGSGWRGFGREDVVAASATFAQDRMPSRATWISSMQGAVSFLAAGADATLWSPAELNRPLVVGDQVATIDEGTAEVRVDAHVLHLGPGTTVEFGRIEGNVLVVDLRQGSLDADAPRLHQGEMFEVDTPNLSLTLSQAGHYRFELDPQGNTNSIIVRDGLCRAISAVGQSFTVAAGQRASVSGTNTVEMAYEQLPGSAPSQPNGTPYASSVAQTPQSDPGADTLSQYGTWRQTSYGMGWSPDVGSGWAPYTQGQWDYIEPGGWTWVDSEPWGFTPFHYGRWAFVHGAWFWIPGAPVYSPALVAWVGGGPGLVGMVGWFPLGPNEPYIAVGSYYPAFGRTRYANIGFATVVTRATFVSAQPIFRSRIQVPSNVLYRASVSNYAAIAATRLSVIGSRRAIAHPPVSVTSRAVVARTPHAAPALALERRQQLWAAAPGRPLSLRQIHPAAYARPNVRMVQSSPQRPSYTPPQRPSYTPPQRPSYTPPQRPSYTPPQQQWPPRQSPQQQSPPRRSSQQQSPPPRQAPQRQATPRQAPPPRKN